MIRHSDIACLVPETPRSAAGFGPGPLDHIVEALRAVADRRRNRSAAASVWTVTEATRAIAKTLEDGS